MVSLEEMEDVSRVSRIIIFFSSIILSHQSPIEEIFSRFFYQLSISFYCKI